MPAIQVRTAAGGAYRVELAPGALGRLGSLAAGALGGPRRVLLVSDANVWPLHGPRSVESLRAAGFEPSEAIIEAGEQAKRLATVERLCEAALEARLDRSGAVVALGGGVVGDIAGLVAALYMRGIPHVQVPTTLLAMVDSSVGGKTAVDLAGGKNLVGAFHQPAAVVADPEALRTLPERELSAGAAEVVKAGLLGDPGLFGLVEGNPAGLLARDGAVLSEAIARSVEVKRRAVEADERETGDGPRALLNLGHTFGHALETLRGYQGILHGEAVAVGMVLAARLSAALGRLSAGDAARVERLLASLGLPVALGADADRRRLFELMGRDKKNRAGRLRLVLPVAIGRAEIAADVPDEKVRRVLEDSP
ncbi:MAG TPA: 3-dehydroquinate synthase [Planctomycetota bacterium]|nr:3-dehydroquinate synthase [Planctomycetota bacterium]